MYGMSFWTRSVVHPERATAPAPVAPTTVRKRRRSMLLLRISSDITAPWSVLRASCLDRASCLVPRRCFGNRRTPADHSRSTKHEARSVMTGGAVAVHATLEVTRDAEPHIGDVVHLEDLRHPRDVPVTGGAGGDAHRLDIDRK